MIDWQCFHIIKRFFIRMTHMITNKSCRVDIKIRSWYTDTHTIRLTSASVTLTSATQIRKEFSVEQKFLHHCCMLEVLQHKSFVDLLSWSSAFDAYKYDSKWAIFDVDYQVWKKSFLKLFRFWCSSASEH
jgi:hypothetical protein